MYFNDVSNFLSRNDRYNSTQKEEAEWRLPVGDLHVNNLTHQLTRAPADSYMRIGYKVMRMLANEEATPRDLLWDRQSHACYVSQMDRTHDSRPLLSVSGYVGICPLEARPGDAIVIIMGARVPYVVRKEDVSDCWTLVGECHVYGIMDGEFMQQDPIPTVETITLH